MFWLTLALYVTAITLAGFTLAKPFGRDPGASPAASARVRFLPLGSFREFSNGR